MDKWKQIMDVNLWGYVFVMWSLLENRLFSNLNFIA
jgi:hypothetical protein